MPITNIIKDTEKVTQKDFGQNYFKKLKIISEYEEYKQKFLRVYEMLDELSAGHAGKLVDGEVFYEFFQHNSMGIRLRMLCLFGFLGQNVRGNLLSF